GCYVTLLGPTDERHGETSFRTIIAHSLSRIVTHRKSIRTEAGGGNTATTGTAFSCGLDTWLAHAMLWKSGPNATTSSMQVTKMTESANRSRWEFWIDVGGTFTDCFALSPDRRLLQYKLLSSGVTKGVVGDDSTRDRIIDPARRRDPSEFWNG